MICRKWNRWCSYYFRNKCWLFAGQEGRCDRERLVITWDRLGSTLLTEIMTIPELVEEKKFLLWLEKNMCPDGNSTFDLASFAQMKSICKKGIEQIGRCISWRFQFSENSEMERKEMVEETQDIGEWI